MLATRYPLLATFRSGLRQLADLKLLLRELEIVVHHDFHELLELHFWLPAELLARFRGIADQQLHLGGPLIALVVFHILRPIEPEMCERFLAKLFHAVRLVG